MSHRYLFLRPLSLAAALMLWVPAANGGQDPEPANMSSVSKVETLSDEEGSSDEEGLADAEDLTKPPTLEDSAAPEDPTEAQTLSPDQGVSAALETTAVAAGQNGHLKPDELALVNEVSAYFNALETLKGSFDQQNQDGTLSTGMFYLRRPGRMRFEYAEPDQLTILSDGIWVMLNDRELESVDRYPLRETPLNLILKKQVDLAKDAEIVRVEREGDLIGVTAREQGGVAQGDLTLVFAGPRLELRHWMVEDIQGNRTVVSLRNVVKGAHLGPELFIPEEYEFGIESDTD